MGEHYNKYVGKIKFLGFEKKGCFVNFDSHLFFCQVRQVLLEISTQTE